MLCRWGKFSILQESPGLIKNIKKSDRSKILVECFDSMSANKIVSSKDSLVEFNLEAHIPNYRISREGIIRNIPLDISMEDIIRFSTTSIKCSVLSTRRFIYENER